MNELVHRFRVQLEKRQYDDMESTWLELVEKDMKVDEMMHLADWVEKAEYRDKLVTLLSLLADDLRDKDRPAEQMKVLRRLARVTPNDPDLSRETARCLRKLHPGVELLERLLNRAGLGYGTRLDRALESFDIHLALLPGTSVYDEDRGPGSTKNMDLLLDKVTVAWFAGGETTLDIAVAGNRLRVSPADGFFTRLARDPAGLKHEARSDPARVAALLMRDVGQPMAVRELQAALAPVVSESEWTGFWDKARKGMARNPHVVVLTSPGRTYRWVDTAAEVPVELAGEGSKVRRAVPSEERLAAIRPDEVCHEYENLPFATARKQLLERLMAARPADWEKLFALLFRIGKDSRSRLAIEKELAEKRPELWRSVLENALTGYRQSPDTFIWLLENSDRLKVAAARGYLTRMLDLLESINHRPHWIALRKRLAAGNYRLVNAALDEADAAEAARLYERVHRCRGIEEFRKEEIGDIFTARYPDLLEPTGDEVWGTRAGIDRAAAELQEMTDKQLPAVAEEIARARAHGDLSENYEYKAAKEKQARLMARISRMREDLARSQVLTADRVDLSKVTPGCRVRLTDESGAESVYTILGPWESDPDKHVISHQSPLAQSLLGKRPGDRVEIEGRPFAVAEISLGLQG